MQKFPVLYQIDSCRQFGSHPGFALRQQQHPNPMALRRLFTKREHQCKTIGEAGVQLMDAAAEIGPALLLFLAPLFVLISGCDDD